MVMLSLNLFFYSRIALRFYPGPHNALKFEEIGVHLYSNTYWPIKYSTRRVSVKPDNCFNEPA